MDGNLTIALAALLAAALVAVGSRALDVARPSRGLAEAVAAAVALVLGQVALVMEIGALWAALGGTVAVLVGLPALRPAGALRPTLLAATVAGIAAGSAWVAGPLAPAVAAAWLLPLAAAARGTPSVATALLGLGSMAAAGGMAWAAAAGTASGALVLGSGGMLLALISRPLCVALGLATELRRRDHEAVRIARRADVVAHFSARTAASLDPEHVLETGLDALVHWSDADLAGIALIRPGSKVIELVAQRNVPETIREELVRTPLPSDAGVVGEVLRHGRPLVLDPASDPRMTRAFPARDGWRSLLMAPLSARERSVGAVCLVSRTPGAFREEDARTLGEITDALGLALDNAYAHARLERERRFSHQMIENAGVMVVAMDPALKITLFNRTAERTFGRGADGRIGESAPVVLAARRDRDRFRRICMAQFGSRPALDETELYAATRDGSVRWHLWRFAVVPGDRDRPSELVCFGIDVTEMRRGRDALGAMREEALRARSRADQLGEELRRLRTEWRRVAGEPVPDEAAAVHPARPAELTTPTGPAPRPASAVVADAPLDGDGLRVLAVDDEESVLEIVRESLGRNGIHVDTARNGRAALDLLEQRAYDLLLSDLRMPGMDGPELYEALRSRRPEMARHTLFLTGDTVSDHARGFLEATGVAYLEKPFEINELLDAVRKATRRGDDGTSGTGA